MTRTAARTHRAAAALAAVVLLAAARAQPIFVPDGAAAEPTMQLSGNTWSDFGPAYTVELQMLDDAGRLSWLRHKSGGAIDPFLAPATQDRRFETFLLRIENRGEGPMIFNPQDCWLVTTSDEILYPMGLDDLAAEYRQLGLELPPAYETVRPALLDGSAILDPGGAATGLLVYSPVKTKTTRFHVDVKLTLSSGDVVKLSAPYRRQK